MKYSIVEAPNDSYLCEDFTQLREHKQSCMLLKLMGVLPPVVTTNAHYYIYTYYVAVVNSLCTAPFISYWWKLLSWYEYLHNYTCTRFAYR